MISPRQPDKSPRTQAAAKAPGPAFMTVVEWNALPAHMRLTEGVWRYIKCGDGWRVVEFVK